MPRPPLDPSVRALGWVSLLNDLSSEVTVRTLPLFLANVLGVGAAVIGIIEGLAESAATLLRPVSGWLADRSGRRKPLTLGGYALSGFTKPLLFFAGGWVWVLVVRLLDRIGKGVRTAPRDALIADLTPAGDRGRAFGFNKAMDKAGAVIGLLAAAAVVSWIEGGRQALTLEGYRALVLLAVIPGIAAVVVLARVREPAHAAAGRGRVPEPASGPDPASSRGPAPEPALALDPASGRGRLDRRFHAYLALMVVFALGNSSDAFLLLRAQSVGLTTVGVFLVVAGFSLVYAVTSTPAGALSDRFGRKRLMAAGCLVYAAIYLGFAFARSGWQVAALYAGYGLHYAAFQGASTALVADLVPAARRGAAFGLYHAAVGAAAFPASALAGWLWQRYGPPAPFLAGGILALIAGLGLVAMPMPATGAAAQTGRK